MFVNSKMAATALLAAVLTHLAAPTAATDCATMMGQCGGADWMGPTCCPEGSVCTPVSTGDDMGGYGGYGIYGGYGGYGSYGSEGSVYSECLPVDATPVGPADVDTQELTVAEILAGLADGTYTSEGLTLAYLLQIAKYEPLYNAFVVLNEQAVEQARASDAKRAAGEPLGALEGVPTVIKEALDYMGYPSTFGWNYTSSAAGGVDLFPLQNAALVQRLIDAGSIILGKTNIPAFSLDSWRTTTSWDGLTLNALNTDLAPGASSAGTATAVAAGFTPWGVAEETGGSIQNPAASQSLVGIKTTFGLIPTKGVTPLAGATRDVLGPIAKTVEDTAIALNVMSAYGTPDFVGEAPEGGYTALLGKKTLEGAIVGLYGPSWYGASPESLTPEVEALYAVAVAELKALGATVIEDPFAGTGFGDLKFPTEGYDKRGSESVAYDFFYYIQGFGISDFDAFRDIVGVTPFDEGQPLANRQTGLPPAETEIFLKSRENPSELPDFGPFEEIKGKYLQILGDVFDKYKLDALVYPQLTEMYPDLLGTEEPVETTVSEVNIAGTPAVTVPSTVVDSDAPMPFALVFTGLLNSEADLLALAYDYEQATQLRLVAELVE